MKRVLCISPHFPPVNAPDMQRLRQALPYFRDMGWEPVVFAVDPGLVEGARDPLLLSTLPEDIEVHHIGAFSPRLTRKIGLGNLGFRCWFQLRHAVNAYLKIHKVDLIFFSTTVFSAIAHGPYWKKRFGVPFIVDLQDPWRNDYYLSLPKAERPQKFWFDHWQKTRLEARTMPEASGVLAVSEAYIKTMCARYPALKGRPASVILFGMDPGDFDQARGAATLKPLFQKNRDTIDIVFAGVVPPSMLVTLRAAIAAVHNLNQTGTPFRFHLVGTQYSAPAIPTDGPAQTIAREIGAQNCIIEHTERKPYFQAVRAVADADILILLGTADTAYSASKLAQVLFANRPIIAILHQQSALIPRLLEAGIKTIVRYDETTDSAALISEVEKTLSDLRDHVPEPPAYDADVIAKYSAKKRLVEITTLMDAVLDGSQPAVSPDCGSSG